MNHVPKVVLSALIACTASLCATKPVFCQSSAQGQPAIPADAIRATINPVGEVRDHSGKLLARVKMTAPGVNFDVVKMNITGDGSVVDASGNVVGKLEMVSGNTDTASTAAPSSPPAATPPASTPVSSPPTQSSVPASPAGQPAGSSVSKPPVEGAAPTSESTVTSDKQVNEESTPQASQAQPSNDQAVEQSQPAPRQTQPVLPNAKGRRMSMVTPERMDEMKARCKQVEDRIDQELQQGHITVGQAQELKNKLANTSDFISACEQTGVMKGSGYNSVCKKCDHLMAKLDGQVAHNARSQVSMKTK
jgi:hypothetical protein